MTPEHLNERRLSPEEENKVKAILSEGSDAIVNELKAHQASGLDESVDAAFQRALVIMAETIARVAALKEFQIGKPPTTGRRLAFMPGYVKKDRSRVVFEVDDGACRLPSDIIHSIGEDGTVELQTGFLNQAKLFHALLREHDDDDGFVNGGTHQFIIANERALTDSTGYQLDVLHISTVKPKRIAPNSKPSLTTSHGFRKLVIDFTSLPTSRSLAEHLSSELNRPGLKPWPHNYQDDAGAERFDAIRQVRAHLVGMWCKVLFDRSGNEQDSWFNECAALAKNNGFTKLARRINELPAVISNTAEEKFDHWYSIRLTSLPDFSTGRNESFGSAMLLTNFELDTRWFYYTRSWINRVYHYFRAFENRQAVLAEVSRTSYKGIYVPIRAPGDRLDSISTNSGFAEPLANYFRACADNPSLKSLMEDAYSDARGALVDLSAAQALFVCKSTLGVECAQALDTAIRKLSTHRLKKNYAKYCSVVEEGCYLFCDKLFGRFFALGAHLGLGMTWGAIHGLLVTKGQADLEKEDSQAANGKWNALFYLTRNVFIPNMVPDTGSTNNERYNSSERIYESLSQYETTLLKSFCAEVDKAMDVYSSYGSHIPGRLLSAQNKWRPHSLRSGTA
jgi:hypothetical protein